MARPTLQMRIIEALETLGCKRVEGCSTRYIVFTKMRGQPGFYFVGKNGALRSGENVTKSMSLEGIVSLENLFAAAERKRQEQNA